MWTRQTRPTSGVPWPAAWLAWWHWLTTPRPVVVSERWLRQHVQ
jgi:hypothetical protein